jgi:hypothetical protein
MVEWLEDQRCKVTRSVLIARLRRGWEFAEALTNENATEQRKISKEVTMIDKLTKPQLLDLLEEIRRVPATT